jgi:hypothetical protein
MKKRSRDSCSDDPIGMMRNPRQRAEWNPRQRAEWNPRQRREILRPSLMFGARFQCAQPTFDVVFNVAEYRFDFTPQVKTSSETEAITFDFEAKQEDQRIVQALNQGVDIGWVLLKLLFKTGPSLKKLTKPDYIPWLDYSWCSCWETIFPPEICIEPDSMQKLLVQQNTRPDPHYFTSVKRLSRYVSVIENNRDAQFRRIIIDVSEILGHVDWWLRKHIDVLPLADIILNYFTIWYEEAPRTHEEMIAFTGR